MTINNTEDDDGYELSEICREICAEVTRLQYHSDYVARGNFSGRVSASPYDYGDLGHAGKSHIDMNFNNLRFYYHQDTTKQGSLIRFSMSVEIELPDEQPSNGTITTTLYSKTSAPVPGDGWLYQGPWITGTVNFLLTLRDDIVLAVDETLERYREETRVWNATTDERYTAMLAKIEAAYVRRG